MDIDWRKAPEGAEMAQKECDVFYATYIKDLSHDNYTLWNVRKGRWHTLNGRPSAYRPLIHRPDQSKSVYTQAMADNGELPKVGMEVLARYNFDSKQVTHQGVIMYISKHHVILNTIHGNEWHGLLGDYIIEPIDQRTDKEKAISEILSHDKSQTFESLLSDAYDKWVGE